MQNYRIFGKNKVEIVIEMGLGSCLSEWLPIAKQLGEEYGVMVYERAGVNKSSIPEERRTPHNIAVELYNLLKQVEHREKIILLAHSQGGLYAQQFCRLYPDLVKGIILLDPLSAKDYVFKEKLTKKEYRKSGVDKSQIFRIMRTFAKLRLGGLTKKLLRNAPPFYYYNEYSPKEIKEILDCADSPVHASTVLEEYICAHEPEQIKGLLEKNNFPDIPLILITHSSDMAIEENMKFGGNSRAFAEKIERMWQGIMKEYLAYSNNSKWIQAKKSTHYIHLQEPDLIKTALNMVEEAV
ncbi:MAG: alpha/beta hydrolase [bacterium]|nr:alpha/beta hydrolase [bacterium]